MATYTFETVFPTANGGKHHYTIEVTAPTESIAWEQLGEKVRSEKLLHLAYQQKKFELLNSDVVLPLPERLTEEQNAIARRILDKSANRSLMTGRYRGENVAIIVESKDLGDKVAFRPVAIVLTNAMLDHIEDFRGATPGEHGTEWEE